MRFIALFPSCHSLRAKSALFPPPRAAQALRQHTHTHRILLVLLRHCRIFCATAATPRDSDRVVFGVAEKDPLEVCPTVDDLSEAAVSDLVGGIGGEEGKCVGECVGGLLDVG